MLHNPIFIVFQLLRFDIRYVIKFANCIIENQNNHKIGLVRFDENIFK